MQKKHALYIRVSTDAQAEEGYSIGAQQERLLAYCTAMAWQETQCYIDAGCSGSNLERPQMQQLIADVKAGQIAAVLVYKLDRLSRSQKDTLYLIEDVFLPNQVDFVSLGESIDTSTPYGRAMIGILSAFAQLERENIFLRTRMGMLERVKQGYWMGGGKVPFGYNYDAKLGILIPNAQAFLVKDAYQQYIAGNSTANIAKHLGFSHDRMVTQMLKRRTYLGLIPYKGKEYAGRHQALIDADTYQLAMQKMQERKAVRVNSDAPHLLTGLLYCGNCGARMRYIRWGAQGYKLRCYGQDRSKSYMKHDSSCILCDAQAAWAQEVEDAVLHDLHQLSAVVQQNSQQGSLQSEAQQLANGIAQQDRKLQRLYQLFADAEDDALLAAIDAVKRTRTQLVERQTAATLQQKSSQHAAWVHGRLAKLSDAWAHLSPNEQQAIVRDCVEKIVIHNDAISIYYTLHLVDSPSAIEL